MISLPPKIDILPEHLIDQIKAGEVIERPGNLIKEIMENAVDAGATSLELIVKNNGLDLISLKDNGHGMALTDLPLAFSRHATSKISRFEDLYRLHTFGFRGEALASISSISRLQCVSFTAGSDKGSEIKIEGGQTIFHGERQKSGQQHGTELVVQDLFYNTPARLKFIQSQQAEKTFIKKIVYAFILSHPEIAFQIKFEEADKEIFTRADSLIERLASMIPRAEGKVLRGERFYENTELEVYLIPGMFKAPLKIQNIYINERFILDKQLHRVMSNALISAFGSDEWHYIAHFNLPGDTIDVNVHPNKTIIKCMESSKMLSLLTSTIKEMAKNSVGAAPSGATAMSHPTADIFCHAESSSPLPAAQLSQERHAYNMEGIFSPHRLQDSRSGQQIWIQNFMLRHENNRWLAISAPKLLNAFAQKKILQVSPSIPLLVSEPIPSKGITLENIQRLNTAGMEIEFLASDTLVLRSIAEWMNGFPLREIVTLLLQGKSLEDIQINPADWSESTWEEMLPQFSIDELINQKIALDLHDLLAQEAKVKVIVISGPTASGKTQISIDLARKFGGEIVNFDSLLLYKEINIGTAKPSQAEQQQVPHHMLDVCSIAHPMNAADYSRAALPIVNKLLSQNKTVYLVGGSGFYLQALLKGMYDSPTTPAAIQQRSNELYEKQGIAPFLEILKEHDPESMQRYHENDHYRVRRAVEHWWTTGGKISDARVEKDTSNQAMPKPSAHGWEVLHIHLDLPKEDHLKLIEKRTALMLKQGLLEEVKALLAQGFTGKEKPLQSIGYKEILDHHFGVYKDLAECQERIIISTRQLAKAQRTWFKRDHSKLTFHPQTEKEAIFEKVQSFLNS